MKEHVDSFNINPPPKQVSNREKIIESCRDDLIMFGRLFLPGDFKNKATTPQFHHTIANALLDNTSTQQLAVVVPRGHAKTTLVKAYITHEFLYNNLDPEAKPLLYGWVADCRDKSYLNLEYVSKHIATNPIIHKYFGNFVGSMWNKLEIKTRNGSTLISRSNAKNVRGETTSSVIGGAQRYNRILLDDIESEENTKTYEAREYLKKVITRAVYPALDNNDGRLIFTGTPVHPDSLCQNILDGHFKSLQNPTDGEYAWDVLTWKATQPDMPGGVLWNSYFPRAKLEEKKKFYMDTTGSLRGYMQEYELEAETDDERIWTRDHYHFHNAEYIWDEELNHSFLKYSGDTFPVKIYIGCDPATDIDTRKADYSAIVVIAYDGKRIFVLDTFAARAIPQLALRDSTGEIATNENGENITKLGVVDQLFARYDMYHADCAIVEDVGMTRGIWQDIEAEQYRQDKHHWMFDPIEPGGQKKRNKIVTGLAPLFNRGQMYVREEQYTLREQIEGMSETMSHDDIIESLFFATTGMEAPKMQKNDKGQWKSTRFKRKRKSWRTA